ncbi:MAG: carbamoyl-phosphate synthase large subunit, partial [Gloeomargarita sp. GMQP_bins_5]
GGVGGGCDGAEVLPTIEQVRAYLRIPNPDRIFHIRHALLLGLTVEEIYELTGIDPWFLREMADLLHTERYLKMTPLDKFTEEDWQLIKQKGFSDRQIAFATRKTEAEIRAQRQRSGVVPVYKTVDTCAAEFEAYTPYHYSTYEQETEVRPTDKPKVVILGGGPNRIGQGIEFDYCCCHAAFALKERGYETIMVNSNPETVSTDYDTSDRLYFEPLTLEDVLNILEAEKPVGVIVQFGGQTPLKLALPLYQALNERPELPTRIWGTSPISIDIAEDREKFGRLLQELGIQQPPNGIAHNEQEALQVARRLGYPVVVRPSYVLGGRAMEIVYSDGELERYMKTAVQVEPDHPILVDKFLENAIEVDVDALRDQEGTVVIGGILEHIEQAGVHSGDSACVLPTYSLSERVLAQIRTWTCALAQRLNVVGLMNVQFAIQGEQVYVLEANPRASRTVPFIAKATGIPLAKLAARVMAGERLRDVGFTQEVVPPYYSVKEVVLPFEKFPGTDLILGPEMRSTGEVMGIAPDFGQAYAKSQIAAGQHLPLSGRVFASFNDRDKQGAVPIIRELVELGFEVVATQGTRQVLLAHGLPVEHVFKLHEGRPHVIDWMKNGQIHLILNTPSGEDAYADGQLIRRTALAYKIPLVTTLAGARATVAAIRALRGGMPAPKTIQDYYRLLR